MDIVIRPVARDDLPALAALEQTCFPDPWNDAGLALLLAAPYGGLCAIADGAVAGYVGWLFFPAAPGSAAEAEITRIAVSPAARRCGIGRTLLEAMLHTLKPDDAPMTVYLDVRASNHAAQALYASLGFTRRGLRPRFYGDEDALEYALHL